MAKLLKLHLDNFAGVPTLDIDFQGRDGCVVGKNRIGKTTVINAIAYLLTDKLLGGSADVPSLKPHGDTKAKVTVEGTFTTPDGEVTLRKEFYEKWVRPRGSEREEMQGHQTDYYVNGAKQARAKDFFEALQGKFGIPAELSGLDAYRLVTDPFYLGQSVCGGKDWKLARKAVMGIVGEVTPEEVYAANGDAAIARADLEAHQYADGEAKKAIRGEIDGYKKRIAADEALIAEHRNALNQDATDGEYESAKADAEMIDGQIAAIKAGAKNPYQEEEDALRSELDALYDKRRRLLMTPVDHSRSEAVRYELNAKKAVMSQLALEQRSAEHEANRLRQDIEEKRARQEGYKKRLQELAVEDKSIVVDDKCPTCGQPLPPEQVQEAVNLKKAQIAEEAQKVRAVAVENKKAIEFAERTYLTIASKDVSKEIAAITEDVAELEKKLAEALREENEAANAQTDPAADARINEINVRLTQIKAAKTGGEREAQSRISELLARKASLNAVFSKRIAAENAKRRIEEIKADCAKSSKALADAEQRLWAVGEYVKTVLGLLDEHMAAKLGEVRFQLIKENIKEGSYDEVCVPYAIDPKTKKRTGTLFPDASKSEQIYTGIQIIKAVRDAKGWNPLPLVFDQGGELDDGTAYETAYDAEAQIICVRVTNEGDKPAFKPLQP